MNEYAVAYTVLILSFAVGALTAGFGQGIGIIASVSIVGSFVVYYLKKIADKGNKEQSK